MMIKKNTSVHIYSGSAYTPANYSDTAVQHVGFKE